MRLPYQTSFEVMGYHLKAFTSTDTRSEDPDSPIPYRYYAAQDGWIVWKFKSLEEAGEWIAARLAG